jgi:hypothetical protein
MVCARAHTHTHTTLAQSKQMCSEGDSKQHIGRYHLVASYDGASMRLFTNGVLTTSSDTQSGGIQYPDTATFAIGAYVDTPYVYPLRGALDDVAVWDRAVAADAVAAMYVSQRESSYFCCPSTCPEGKISSGLCVGDANVDCQPAFPCPKCSAGMCTPVISYLYKISSRLNFH